MQRYSKYLFLSVLAVGLTALIAFAFQSGSVSADLGDDSNSLNYLVQAKDGYRIRQVTGEVTSSVDGVPAAPVDSFVWAGGTEGIVPLDNGFARINVDPVSNTGEIIAKWKDEYGNWEYRQTVFAAPPHSTGLEVGPSASDTRLIWDDPITTNVYLHGDTTAGGPVIPTEVNLLSTWGPAEVTLNGEPFENPFDDDLAPLWEGHSMVTVGLRNENGEVLTEDGSIFNPMKAGQGITYDDQLVFHLVFSDAPFDPVVPENIPAPFSFFYHLTFEDIKITINN